MNRLKTFAVASAAAVGVIALGAGTIHAATNTANPNPMSGLVTAIAQKFGLNQSDVQQVFDQQRAQMEQDMQAKHLAEQKTQLDQAVKDGKISQAQEDLLIAKQAEIKTAMDALKDKTPAERETAMQAQKTALNQWAKDNNIPEQYLMMGGRGGWGDHGQFFGGNHDPKAMLDQAVKDGKITQAQEDLIVAKQAESKTFMEGLKDKTVAERTAALEAQKTALTQWAKDNNIPEQYVGFGGARGGKMMGRPGRR